MLRKQHLKIRWQICITVLFFWIGTVHAGDNISPKSIYSLGELKPRDSITTLKVGDNAPNFSLPSMGGLNISLWEHLWKKNVVISFIPAAWSPVCSMQWPEYNKAKEMFEKNDAVLFGISVDNAPSLFSWAKNMCGVDDSLWFTVLSDFFPHGEVARKYGVLRSDGLSERAIFVIDKHGVIRFIDIHDINKKPPLKELQAALEDLQ
jgi:peroxiredoxin